MKITFWGTGASEGFPAVFCQCPCCQEARRRGQKNIRTRTSAQIDSSILVDFSADSYAHTLFGGLDLSKIHHLFVTHSHEDHFYPCDLLAANYPNADLPDGWHLEIYGNQKVHRLWDAITAESTQKNTRLSFTQVRREVPVEADGYSVVPLAASHDDREECFLYLIRHGGKTLLYAHDTAWFPDGSWAALQGQHLDGVVLDCTSVQAPHVFSNHMSFEDDLLVRDKMLREGIAGPDTKFIATHFAHRYAPFHEELTAAFAAQGFVAAYDGMELEL